MSAKMFLLYRPVMDYEESMEPYAIFSTREKAEKARDYIVAWGQKVISNIPPWPDDALQGSDEWNAAFDARESHIKDISAPFGLGRMSNDIHIFCDSFAPNCVAVMELANDPDPNSKPLELGREGAR